MRRHHLPLYGFLALILTAFVNAELKIGTLRSPSCFEPVAKFAYATTPGDSDDGKFHARVQFREENYKHLWLVTYSQEEWKQVYRSSLTCGQRLDFARNTRGRSDDHVVIPVYDDYYTRLKWEKTQEGAAPWDLSHDDLVSCTDGTVQYDTKFKINDERTDWYYVAMINVDAAECNRTGGVRCQGPLMNISYRLNFRNLNYVGYYDALPANKIGLVHIATFNMAACLALVVIAIFVGCKLKTMNEYHYIVEAPSLKRQMLVSKRLLQSNEVIDRFNLPAETLVSKPKHVKNKCHVTIKGLIAAVICYFLANLFWFTHYMVFIANEGLELVAENLFSDNKVRILYLLGEICWMVSDVCMATLGIVFAKGWTLVRRKLSARSRAIYGMLLCMYFFVGTGAIFWNVSFFTEYDAVDFFDSLPAGMFVVFRGILFIGFLWALRTTFKKFTIKRNFFIKFGVLYGLWFVSIGIFAGIVNGVGRSYLYREAMLHLVMSFTTLLAQYLLVFMYWPGMKCCLAKRFPFHADVDDMLNPSFHHALDIIKDNADLSAKEISAKIREEGIDPLAKLLAIMQEITSRLEVMEDNEVDLRCAFEELEDEDERVDDLGEDLGAEKRAPKLNAFGRDDFAAMEDEHGRQRDEDRPH